MQHMDASDKDMLGEGGTFERGFETIPELQVEFPLNLQSWKDMSPKYVVLVREQMEKTVLHSKHFEKRVLPMCTTRALQGLAVAVH